jgi:hypothetical protein
VNIGDVGLDWPSPQGTELVGKDTLRQPLRSKESLTFDKEIDLEFGRLGTADREMSLLAVSEGAQDVLDMARVSGTEIVVDTHRAVVDGEMAEDATVVVTEGDVDDQYAENILGASVCSAKVEVVDGGRTRDSMEEERVLGLDSAMVAASAGGEVAADVAAAAVAVSAQVWRERDRRHQTY